MRSAVGWLLSLWGAELQDRRAPLDRRDNIHMQSTVGIAQKRGTHKDGEHLKVRDNEMKKTACT